MSICSVCGRQRAGGQDPCPFCGCPPDRFVWSDTPLPPPLNERYELAGLAGNSCWALVSRAGGEHVAAGVIPATEAGEVLRERLRLQQREKLRCLPELMELGENYYIFRRMPDSTLRCLLERENPIPEEKLQDIRAGMRAAAEVVHAMGYEQGDLTLDSFVYSEGEVHLADFGDGSYPEQDNERIERLIQRMAKGYWPEQTPPGGDDPEEDTAGEEHQSGRSGNVRRWLTRLADKITGEKKQ